MISGKYIEGGMTMFYNELEFRLYSVNGKYYLFDYLNFLLVEINYELYHILEKKSISENELGKYSSFLKMLRDNKMCQENDEIFNVLDKRQYEVATISFPTSHSCNLACKYCFASAGNNYSEQAKNMESPTLKRILERVYKEYFADYKIIKIDFVSGGEPLINFNIIKETVQICNVLNEFTGKENEMFVCTNATLLNEEILDFFSNSNIKLGISIDGLKQVHDYNRIYKDGTGTYNDVKKWIDRIVNSPSLSNKTRDFLILTVVSNRTDSIVDILKDYKKLGISNIQFKICRGNNEEALCEANLKHFEQLYDELNVFLMNQISNGNFEYLYMILNDNDYYGKIIRRLVLGDRSIRRCQVGRNKLCFTANGDIYPCDSFVGYDKYKIGNVYLNDTVINPLKDLNFKSSCACNNCWARYICSGDCYYDSMLVTGSIYKPDKVFCHINKRLIDNAICLIGYINSISPEALAEIERFLYIREKMFA